MAAHRKRRAVLGGLLAWAVLGLGLAVALAGLWRDAQGEAFPRFLDDIRLFGRGETIQLAFSQPFDGQPSEEHAPGRMALTFVGVGSQKPIRDLRPREESLFREIKVVQNRYSTTVTFLLRDADLSLKDRVGFGRNKNVLTVELRLEGPAGSTSASGVTPRPASESLLTEMEQKIAGGAVTPVSAETSAPVKTRSAPAPATITQGPANPGANGLGVLGAGQATPISGSPVASGTAGASAATAPLGLGGVTEGNFFTTLATMVVGLAIMLGMLYGVLYLYKRYFQSRLARFAGTPALRQIASFSIGPRQRIVILEINGEWIACGVTPSQITFLTRLSGQRPPTPESAVAETAPKAPESEQNVALPKADPVHQFAEVLKQKVRSLKRIN
jgi:flagellar protein FliO/FliZ